MMDEMLQATETSLLKSHWFRSKPQMQRLLTYLIKHSYENNNQGLQQKAIAVECLGRTKDFIPSQDPIVRIEAARLRKLLDAFYEDTKLKLPYRISLPKGSYRICFMRNENNSLSTGLGLFLVCQSSHQASSKVLKLMLTVRAELSERISRFHHVDLTVEHLPKHQVSQKGSVHFLAEKQHDYVLRVEVVGDGRGGCQISSVVIHQASQEILWSNSTLIPEGDDSSSLELLYKNVVRSLISDSFGLLGRHWSSVKKQEGLGDVPRHKGSWVHLIGLINKPSAFAGRNYLHFLSQRLKKYPSDYVAYAGYLCLVFQDFYYKFGMFDSSLDERREQLLRAVREYPTYDVFTVLLGLYCFSTGENENADAKAYVETGLRLNPYNSSWGYIFGGALYFTGERERGMALINEVNKGFEESNAMPGFYLLSEFLYRLGKDDEPSKTFQLGIQLGFNSEQWSNIGALKDHPDLVAYCLEAINASVLES